MVLCHSVLETGNAGLMAVATTTLRRTSTVFAAVDHVQVLQLLRTLHSQLPWIHSLVSAWEVLHLWQTLLEPALLLLVVVISAALANNLVVHPAPTPFHPVLPMLQDPIHHPWAK